MSIAVPTAQVVAEFIWRPLVHIPPDRRGLLVHPGMPKLTQHLSSGWHWHWPWLTSIISQSDQPHDYIIQDGIAPRSNLFADEAIVAVSKDHRLVRFEAIVTITLDPEASLAKAARINGRFIDTILRPKIRQAFREPAASRLAGDILEHTDKAAIQPRMRELFAGYPITIGEVKIRRVTPYAPFTPISALAIGQDADSK
jgi:hypothetical protein